MDMLEYVEENKDVWFAEGRAEGEAKGRAEGKAEGWAEGKAEVARNLLHLGLSIPQIAEATGLSPAEIEALRKVSNNAPSLFHGGISLGKLHKLLLRGAANNSLQFAQVLDLFGSEASKAIDLLYG